MSSIFFKNLIIRIINATFLNILNTNGGTWMKVHLWIGGLLFPLTFLLLITFPRNLAQIFRRGRSTYVRSIFFHSFYTFEVMAYFVAEESFLNKHLASLLNVTPRIWLFQPSFLWSAFNHKCLGGYQISAFYIMNYGNHLTKRTLYLYRDTLSILTDFFINRIFFIYLYCFMGFQLFYSSNL